MLEPYDFRRISIVKHIPSQYTYKMYTNSSHGVSITVNHSGCMQASLLQ